MNIGDNSQTAVATQSEKAFERVRVKHADSARIGVAIELVVIHAMICTQVLVVFSSQEKTSALVNPFTPQMQLAKAVKPH